MKPPFAIAFAQAAIILIVNFFTKELLVRLFIAARTVAPTAGYKTDLQRFVAILLLLGLFWLAGCGEQQPQASATPLAEVALVDEEIVTPAPMEAAAVPEPPATESESVDECLRCHTDKEMLIATAKPEEVVISENEGEG